MLWIKLIIKYCVSFRITDILQNDKRSILYQISKISEARCLKSINSQYFWGENLRMYDLFPVHDQTQFLNLFKKKMFSFLCYDGGAIQQVAITRFFALIHFWRHGALSCLSLPVLPNKSWKSSALYVPDMAADICTMFTFSRLKTATNFPTLFFNARILSGSWNSIGITGSPDGNTVWGWRRVRQAMRCETQIKVSGDPNHGYFLVSLLFLFHTDTHMHMHMHTHICTHPWTHTLTHTHTWTRSHTHTHVHTCKRAHTYTCTHICKHTYTFIHTHMRTHANTLTHAQKITHAQTHTCTHSHWHTHAHSANIHTHMRTHMHTHV